MFCVWSHKSSQTLKGYSCVNWWKKYHSNFTNIRNTGVLPIHTLTFKRLPKYECDYLELLWHLFLLISVIQLNTNTAYLHTVNQFYVSVDRCGSQVQCSHFVVSKMCNGHTMYNSWSGGQKVRVGAHLSWCLTSCRLTIFRAVANSAAKLVTMWTVKMYQIYLFV